MIPGTLPIFFTRGDDYQLQLLFGERVRPENSTLTAATGSAGGVVSLAVDPLDSGVTTDDLLLLDDDHGHVQVVKVAAPAATNAVAVSVVAFDPVASFSVGTSVFGFLAHDYSGMTFAAQIRSFEDAEIVTEFTVDDTNLDMGILLLSLSKTQTALLGREYAWDLEVTDGANKVTTLLAGQGTVKLDVTRVVV